MIVGSPQDDRACHVDAPWLSGINAETTPLRTAIATLRRVANDDLGLGDEEYATFIAARRLMFGSQCGFVAAYDSSERREIDTACARLPNNSSSEDWLGNSVGLTQADRELFAGIQVLGKYRLASCGTGMTMVDVHVADTGGLDEGSEAPTKLAQVEAPPQQLSASQLLRSDLHLAGLPTQYRGEIGFVFHRTRGTFSSWLARRGTPYDLRRFLLGHGSVGVTDGSYEEQADRVPEEIAKLTLAITLDDLTTYRAPTRTERAEARRVAKATANHNVKWRPDEDDAAANGESGSRKPHRGKANVTSR